MRCGTGGTRGDADNDKGRPDNCSDKLILPSSRNSFPSRLRQQWNKRDKNNDREDKCDMNIDEQAAVKLTDKNSNKRGNKVTIRIKIVRTSVRR